jgi:hypothetical protein
MPYNFSELNLWTLETFTIRSSVTQEALQVEFPVNILSKIIPSIKLQAFKDTKVFEIGIKDLDKCVRLINQLIVGSLYDGDSPELDDFSLEELVAWYSFCDLYMDPESDYTCREKQNIRYYIFVDKLGYLYHPFGYLYENDFNCGCAELVQHLNALMKQIGHTELYHFVYKEIISEPHAIHVINVDCDKDINLHNQTICYLLEKAEAFKGKVSDEMLLVLESIDSECRFTGALRGEHLYVKPKMPSRIGRVQIPSLPPLICSRE